jgi:hypothetical protein
MEGRVPGLLATALRAASTRLTSTISPSDTRGGGTPGAVGAGAYPGIPGGTARPPPEGKQTADLKPGTSTISNQTSEKLND